MAGFRFRVKDTTYLSLRGGYPQEDFDSLADAFEHIADELEGGSNHSFEVSIIGHNDGFNVIQIDAESFIESYNDLRD